jgi:serine protease Do
MKSSPWHWSALLLAAALFLPAGLRAQSTAPAPLPPEAEWIGQAAGQDNPGQQREMLRVFDISTPDSGWLGVSITEVTAERAKQDKLPKTAGVFVQSVEKDSPAAKAGIKANDVIVEYNGQAVQGVLQFRRLVRETPPGRTVAMKVWRNGRSQTLSAAIGKPQRMFESRLRAPRVHVAPMPLMPEMGTMPRGLLMMRGFNMHPLLGVEVQEVSGQLGKYFAVPGDRGILVVSVTTGSAAEKAGIKAGDIIYQVAGKPVHSVDRLEQALREDCTADGVSLGLVRKGVTLVQRVQIQCPPSSHTSDRSALTR